MRYLRLRVVRWALLAFLVAGVATGVAWGTVQYRLHVYRQPADAYYRIVRDMGGIP